MTTASRKKITSAQKIRLLCKEGPVTRRDVELALGVSPGAAHTHIRSLLRQRHIKAVGFCNVVDRRGQRQVTQYALTQAGARKMKPRGEKENDPS